MADPIIRLKRSAVFGKIPTADQLPLGEVALNTYDGYLYASKNVGIGTTVIAINPFRVGTGTDTYNTYFTQGNVGLGTTNPTSLLHVDGTAQAINFVGINSGSVSFVTATETLTNKTLRNPTFESGANSPEFIETRYANATQQDFVQLYTGGSSGSYFTQGEYQKIATITPSGNSQNYTFIIEITATSASNYQIVRFTGGLRSNTLPDLSFTVNYSEEHNGVRFIEPKLWTKETTTAAFILAFEYVHNQNLYGGVNVDATIIPRSNAQRANVAFNTTQNSEQSSIDSGFTENDPTLTLSTVNGIPIFGTQFQIEGSTDNDFETTITSVDATADRTITFPDSTGTVAVFASDGDANQVLATDGSGTLSFVDAATQGTTGAQGTTGTQGIQGVQGIQGITGSDAGGATGVDYNDNVKVRFGTGDDLEIYHDGSNSYVEDTGTGALILKGSFIRLHSNTGENMLTGSANGAVQLMYNNGTRLATTSSGVTITGTAAATTFSGSGASLTNVNATTLDSIDSTSFLRSDAADTASGNILFSSNYTRFVSGNTNNTSTADTNGVYIHLDGSYEDGRYTTRFRKYDNGGGVPLYIDNSGGTANIFTAIARFGAYSGNSNDFEVFGDAAFNGTVDATSYTGDGSALTGVGGETDITSCLFS